MMEIWVEKYRPAKLDEVIGQEKVVSRLKGYVASKSMPHLLFSGPPGTGKTTCALAFVKELFGENWQNNFIELNASDERGIPVVRGKIKEFARVTAVGDVGFKVIFLDEADALTPEAQNALRRTMEMYSRVCRFILSCNYSSKIIEPIQSRCAIFRFAPVSKPLLLGRLKEIAAREKVQVDEDALDSIAYLATGDVRKAINILQTCSATEEKITMDIVYHVTGRLKGDELKAMLDCIMKKDFNGAKNVLDKFLIEQGMSAQDFLEDLHRYIIESSIDEELKVKIAEKIGETDFRVSEGSNERIQVEALIAQLILLCSKK
ncbi:MAG: replication factor C small subunit [Thermoplasmata archaeon]|nr:replication factor C small subunit [Thermoplasmata archaeon]